MDSVDHAANENLLFPILPGLVDTTIALIGTPASEKIDYKLQTECVNFLSKLVQTFPKQMGDKVSMYLGSCNNSYRIREMLHLMNFKLTSFY